VKVWMEHFVLGELMTNSFLVGVDEEVVLIDPAVPAQEIADFINKRGLHLRFIANTHGHIDHIGGNDFFKRLFPEAKLVVSEQDLVYLDKPELNLSSELGRPYRSPFPDLLFNEEVSTLKLKKEEIKVYFTPGHTPGSVCFYFATHKWLFSGDTLFAGSIGRTDLPGGSMRDLLESLEKLFRDFDPDTEIFPGHGPFSTLARERATNPFVLEYLNL